MASDHSAIENRIDVTWHDTDIAIVSLVGEHDLSTSDELLNQLESLVRGREAVIVDLSAAEFIDSSVLNSLVRVSKLAQPGSRSGARALGIQQPCGNAFGGEPMFALQGSNAPSPPSKATSPLQST